MISFTQSINAVDTLPGPQNCEMEGKSTRMSIFEPITISIPIQLEDILTNRHFSQIHSINERIENLLTSMEALEDNWDEDDALAPDSACLQLAKEVVSEMNKIGQGIYQTAPGPNGEVMLDFRNKNKSFELLFYPSEKIWVTFGDSTHPRQGEFTWDILQNLLSWLNC